MTHHQCFNCTAYIPRKQAFCATCLSRIIAAMFSS